MEPSLAKRDHELVLGSALCLYAQNLRVPKVAMAFYVLGFIDCCSGALLRDWVLRNLRLHCS
jgi:hypothetical protein